MTSLEALILDILDTNQPENVKELVTLVQEQVNAKLGDIEEVIKSLQRKGLVSLEAPKHNKEGFISFLSPKKNYWFWVVITISILSFVSIILIPENGTSLSYVRYVFGFVLVAFLPGYCLTETLFPRANALDIIERITFSIGLSFAITALIGLFLSFTHIGLTLATALPALSSVVFVLATLALARKHNRL